MNNENYLNLNLSSAWLQSTLVKKERMVLKDTLSPNCFAFTHYGLSFGVEEVINDFHLFSRAIAVQSLKIIYQTQLGKITLLQFDANCRHIGEFCGIEATGKHFTFKATILLHWDETYIRDYFLFPDMQTVLTQLSDNNVLKRKYPVTSPLQDHGDVLLFNIIATAQSDGLHLTRQQGRCLALYFQGYSTVVSAKILGCSYQTVRTHIKTFVSTSRMSSVAILTTGFVQGNLIRFSVVTPN